MNFSEMCLHIGSGESRTARSQGQWHLTIPCLEHIAPQVERAERPAFGAVPDRIFINQIPLAATVVGHADID